MVPPMFFGEVPEAGILEKYDVSEHLNRVKGDIAESKVYHALKNYYKRTGDDVLVVHSHKLLNKAKNKVNEKDFIIFNLSKGKQTIIIPKVYLRLQNITIIELKTGRRLFF